MQRKSLKQDMLSISSQEAEALAKHMAFWIISSETGYHLY